MKRTNVVLDEQVLEEALRLSGERTYSAVINKALAEMVRVMTLKRGIAALQSGGDPFWPGYIEEIRPNYSGQKRAEEKKEELPFGSMIRDAPRKEPLPPPKKGRRGPR